MNLYRDKVEEKFSINVALLIQECKFVLYRRSGFNCEILLNANCEFFKSSQLINSQK